MSAPRLALAAAALLAVVDCRRSNTKPPAQVVEIAAGGTTTCARFADGGISCWGTSGPGLIDSTAKPDSRSYIPFRAESAYYAAPVPTKAPRGANAIVLGDGHGCALMADGTVSCWGGNAKCQLGRPSGGAERNEAAAVGELANVNGIAARADHTCAVLEDGRVRCWGVLDEGPSDASCGARDAPAPPGATQVAVGRAHACSLQANGTVWCWGMNKKGQLGRGQVTYEREPRSAAVVGLSDVREIALGRDTSCARRGDGTVWCWGGNGNGELGVGEYGDRATPSQVPGLRDVARLALGTEHACVILADASVRCWGARLVVGDGTDLPKLAPTPVVGVGPASQLALGGITTMGHSCALLKEGTVRCWGHNFYGQLGDDSTTWTSTPVAVVW